MKTLDLTEAQLESLEQAILDTLNAIDSAGLEPMAELTYKGDLCDILAQMEGL